MRPRKKIGPRLAKPMPMATTAASFAIRCNSATVAHGLEHVRTWPAALQAKVLSGYGARATPCTGCHAVYVRCQKNGPRLAIPMPMATNAASFAIRCNSATVAQGLKHVRTWPAALPAKVLSGYGTRVAPCTRCHEVCVACQKIRTTESRNN